MLYCTITRDRDLVCFVLNMVKNTLTLYYARIVMDATFYFVAFFML